MRTLTKIPPKATEREEELLTRVGELETKLREAQREAAELRAQLEGDIPSATYWLQTKVWRQRSALDRLHTRVVTQRLILHAMSKLGRDLSREEWQAALAELDNPQVRARIEQDLK